MWVTWPCGLKGQGERLGLKLGLWRRKEGQLNGQGQTARGVLRCSSCNKQHRAREPCHRLHTTRRYALTMTQLSVMVRPNALNMTCVGRAPAFRTLPRCRPSPR